MSKTRYPEQFKTEAVKQVTEECDLLKKPRRTSQATQTKIHLYQGSLC